MEKLLEDLPVTEEIAVALRGGENDLRGIYDLMIAYERGTWNAVAKAARRVNVEEKVLPDCYMQATEKASMLV